MLTGRLFGGRAREVGAVHQDFPGRGGFEAADDSQEGGFAAAGGAQQGEEFVGADVQRDIADGLGGAEALGEVADLNHRVGHFRRSGILTLWRRGRLHTHRQNGGQHGDED